MSLLDPTDQLVRVSVALRGTRPTPEELHLVGDDPDALAGLVDAWLDDDAHLGQTVRDLHAEQLLTRIDAHKRYQYPALGPVEGIPSGELQTAIMEEPLELIAHVVTEDRPYSEILTADYAYADAHVAAIWGLEHDPDGPAWQETRWTDGRPHAGLLSSSWLWIRHKSAASNFHRGRAAFLTGTLLCDDFHGRDIPVDDGIDLADPDELADALTSDPSCVACHDTLDPLAAHFWGYKRKIDAPGIRDAYAQGCVGETTDLGPEPPYPAGDYCYPLTFYRPEDEGSWAEWGLQPPGFYGAPGTDLVALGATLADDPRFPRCTARRFASWFTQTPLDEVPDGLVDRLTDDFLASGLSAKALVRAVLLSDDFLAAEAPDGQPSLLLTRPEQLARTVHGLTGIRWTATPDPEDCGDACWGEVDLLRSDMYGFRTLAGGVDGMAVTVPSLTPSPSRTLVLEQLAFDAAAEVVVTDLALPADERRLLTSVEADEVDEAAVRAQLADLHARITSELLAPDEVDATWALWSDTLARSGEPERAWMVVIAALLQDPRVRWH